MPTAPYPQPIETEYNGYRFRSRREARWAVFLDHVHFRYEYEVEGFNLDGTRYLPDFYLPGDDRGWRASWVEIKPGVPDAGTAEKARRLKVATGENVYVFGGDIWTPDVETYEGAFVLMFDTGAEAEAPPEVGCWAGCLGCGWTGICGLEALGRADHGCGHTGALDAAAPWLVDAYRAARQARFEHGEKPGQPKGWSRWRG
jgi:hypothetical protein